MREEDGTVRSWWPQGRASLRIRAVLGLALGAAGLLLPAVALAGGSAAPVVLPRTVPDKAHIGLVDMLGTMAAAPAITGISPTKASAGTGDTVTITGSGFGAYGGNAQVTFLFKPFPLVLFTEYIPANSIRSWTDTSIVCEVPVDEADHYARSAGSGTVTVTDAGGHVSRAAKLSVSFGFWFRLAGPVRDYAIATANAGWRQMVRAAADTWSSAGSQFRFKYLPKCPANPSLGDGVSEVYWAYLPRGVLAQTQPGLETSEMDIVFNKRYPWGSHLPKKYDVQTLALHEMGHALGLRDLYGAGDKGKVMYGNFTRIGSYGVRRTLSADDIAGVKWVYPGPAFPVCTGAGTEGSPAVSGTTVVWDDNRNGNWDIYGRDVATGREFPICTAAGDQLNPAISGGIVVWEDERNGGGDIYGRDLATGREFPICTSAGEQGAPAISGSTVVWLDTRNDNIDIYGRDLTTGREFLVKRGDSDWMAELAISGDTVVWLERSGHYGFDIYGRDLATGREFPICTARGERYSLAISGSAVVWGDWRNGNWDIYGCDLPTGREFPICTAPDDQVMPAISGSTVVWQDGRYGRMKIAGCDLATGRGRVLPASEGDQVAAAVSDRTVVWYEYQGEVDGIYGATLQP